MTRSLMVGLVAGMMLLTACNDPNKNKSSTMTTDDTSYPTAKSDTSNTYTPSNSSASTTPITHPPVYTTTTVTPATGDSSGSGSYSSTPGSYTTSSSTPPVTTTVISPAGSGNTEMSGDESLSPSGRSKSRSGDGGQTYTVKSGDSLSKISKKVYGDGSKWNRIYNANKSKISNPNQLKVGTKLVIP